MPLTAYKMLKGTTQTQLAQAVQLELSLGNRVLVYQPWSRGGYLCQGVGTGTIDSGTVTNYFIITSAVDETFVSLLNTQLPYYQPVGAPIMHNNALYQVMALITAGTGGGGTPGKTPELRVAAGYIQWKYQTDAVWNNLIALSAMAGPSVQLSVNDGYIKWKQSNSEYWETLVSLDSLKGPANTLSVGSVSTVTPSTPAAATVTGTAPAQTLNLTIPRGNAGTNSVVESLTGTVVTAGTAVSLTFTKTYTTAPIVVPIPQWNSQQMITGAAITVTTTGCTFLAMQSRGTLLLTSGPFENAAAGQTFKVLVIGN